MATIPSGRGTVDRTPTREEPVIATLEPGKAALFLGPAPDCKVEHTDHRNSLCIIVAIEPEREKDDGHTVLCRAQDGTMGYARPDELRPIDDWGVGQEEREQIPDAVAI